MKDLALPGRERPEFAHFARIPWCAKLIADPAVFIWVPAQRLQRDATPDKLFGRTLHTPDTISAFLCFHEPLSIPTAPSEPPSGSSSRSDSADGNVQAQAETPAAPAPAPALVKEAKFLLTLQPGLCGFDGVLHGGIAASVFDSCCALLGYINIMHKLLPPLVYTTQYLHVDYARLVRLPQTVLVEACIVESCGDDHVLEAVMRDAGGTALASARTRFCGRTRRGLTAQL